MTGHILLISWAGALRGASATIAVAKTILAKIRQRNPAVARPVGSANLMTSRLDQKDGVAEARRPGSAGCL